MSVLAEDPSEGRYAWVADTPTPAGRSVPIPETGRWALAPRKGCDATAFVRELTVAGAPGCEAANGVLPLLGDATPGLRWLRVAFPTKKDAEHLGDVLLRLPRLSALEWSDFADARGPDGISQAAPALESLRVYCDALKDEHLAPLARLRDLSSLVIEQGTRGIRGPGLTQLAALMRLRRLELDGPGLRDLDALSTLTSLEVLRLGNQVRPTSFEPLTALARLRHLQLPDKVGAKTIDAVSRLPLSRLEIHHADDRSLQRVARLEQLESLDVFEGFTEEGIRPLTSLGKLRTLRLHEGRPAPDTFEGLIGSLEELHTSGAQLDEGSLRAAGPRLRVLRLSQAKALGDASLEALAARAPNLEVLHLEAPRVTARGVKALAALPRLRDLTLRGLRRIDPPLAAAVGSLPALEQVSFYDKKLDPSLGAAVAAAPRLLSISGKSVAALFPRVVTPGGGAARKAKVRTATTGAARRRRGT